MASTHLHPSLSRDVGLPETRALVSVLTRDEVQLKVAIRAAVGELEEASGSDQEGKASDTGHGS